MKDSEMFNFAPCSNNNRKIKNFEADIWRVVWISTKSQMSENRIWEGQPGEKKGKCLETRQKVRRGLERKVVRRRVVIEQWYQTRDHGYSPGWRDSKSWKWKTPPRTHVVVG